MKNRNYRLISFLQSAVFVIFAASFSREAFASPNCKVTGLTSLKQYLLPAERRCFSSVGAAEAAGFALQGASVPHRRRRSECDLVGIKGTGILLSRPEVRCFRSRRKAETRGYTHYTLPVDAGGTMIYDTPVPRETPRPTPTRSPSSDPGAIDYPDIVLWRNEVVNGSSTGRPVGRCAATLSGDRSTLTMGCTYDYPDITELHIHLPPDNTEYCPAPVPASPVAPYNCALTPDVARGILEGKVFVMIHAGPIGEGEMITAAGYF